MDALQAAPWAFQSCRPALAAQDAEAFQKAMEEQYNLKDFIMDDKRVDPVLDPLGACYKQLSARKNRRYAIQ